MALAGLATSERAGRAQQALAAEAGGPSSCSAIVPAPYHPTHLLALQVVKAGQAKIDALIKLQKLDPVPAPPEVGGGCRL